MNNKIIGTLNIAKKASKLLLGADVCYSALEENKARLVLISSDCAKNSIKRIAQMCQENGVPLVTLEFDKVTLGKYLGKASVAILAVTDTGLASSVGKNLANANPENNQVAETLDLKLKRQKERVARKNDENAKPRPKKNKTQAMYVDDDKIDEKVLEQKLIRREEFHKKMDKIQQQEREVEAIKKAVAEEKKPKPIKNIEKNTQKSEIKLEKLEIKPQTVYNSNIPTQTLHGEQSISKSDDNTSLNNNKPKKQSVFGKLFGKNK